MLSLLFQFMLKKYAFLLTDLLLCDWCFFTFLCFLCSAYRVLWGSSFPVVTVWCLHASIPIFFVLSIKFFFFYAHNLCYLVLHSVHRQPMFYLSFLISLSLSLSECFKLPISPGSDVLSPFDLSLLNLSTPLLPLFDFLTFSFPIFHVFQ